MSKVIALYKTWRGEEFLEGSILSIYNHVNKIVFIHSEVSWCGEKGNTVKPWLNEWKKKNDPYDKIIDFTVNTTSQDEQYKVGFGIIKRNFDPDFVLIIDTDEVWDDENLTKLLDRAKNDKEHSGFFVSMHTYIKSPYYRITPKEPCMPLVLYNLRNGGFCSARGCGMPDNDKKWYGDIYMHHFTYVRESEDVLFKKIKNIYEAEKTFYDHIDLDEWKREKWDKLPSSTDIHTAKGYEHFWKGVKVITDKDLPVALKNNKLINSYKGVKVFNSEHKQDEWLENNYFKGRKDGVFVEFGALDGKLHSNSLFFEQYHNWSGLLIEANPDAFEECRKNRPNAICENLAVGDEYKLVNFEKIEGGLFGWSGVTDYIETQHKDRIKQHIPDKYKQTIKVMMSPLNDILEKHGLFKVDYMTMDVEGAEYFILKKFDFDRFNVDVFDIENNFDNYPIEKLMNKNGYKKLTRIDINDIYVRVK
jgi:FkbM family methyltransferase